MIFIHILTLCRQEIVKRESFQCQGCHIWRYMKRRYEVTTGNNINNGKSCVKEIGIRHEKKRNIFYQFNFSSVFMFFFPQYFIILKQFPLTIHFESIEHYFLSLYFLIYFTHKYTIFITISIYSIVILFIYFYLFWA